MKYMNNIRQIYEVTLPFNILNLWLIHEWLSLCGTIVAPHSSRVITSNITFLWSETILHNWCYRILYLCICCLSDTDKTLTFIANTGNMQIQSCRLIEHQAILMKTKIMPSSNKKMMWWLSLLSLLWPAKFSLHFCIQVFFIRRLLWLIYLLI